MMPKRNATSSWQVAALRDRQSRRCWRCAGFKVVLVDKDKHPRFHIGESLLPFNVPLFEQLGVADEVKRIGMLKLGIEFVSPYHAKRRSYLDFGDAWDKSKPYSYQVRRSEFDHILLKNAAAKGATVIEECRVTGVEFLPEGGAVVVTKAENKPVAIWRAKFFVDATGRDTFLAGKMDLKRRNPHNRSAAIYGHFTGAKRLEGKLEGNITIFWFQHGWFWFIPLSDGTTSIGAVCDPDYIKGRGATDLTQFFHDTLAMAPALMERLTGAELTHEPTATGNYSYQSTVMHGKSHIMVGDAFAFIDPVFSTGVYMAMRGGFLGADAVASALQNPAKADRAMRKFDREVRTAIKTFSWYIYRINRPAIRTLFMNPRNVLRMKEAVLSILSGEVSRRSPIHASLALFRGLYHVNNTLMKWRGIRQEPVPAAADEMAIEARQKEAA